MPSRGLLIVPCLIASLTATNAAAQTPKPKDGPLGMKFVPLPKATSWSATPPDQALDRSWRLTAARLSRSLSCIVR
jgi:hypothetical protein